MASHGEGGFVAGGQPPRAGRGAPALLVLAVLSAPWAPGCGGGPTYPTRDAAVEVPVETGSVVVTGGFDVCPIVILRATPEMAPVGQTIAVSARVSGGGDGGISDGGTRPDSGVSDGGGAFSLSWTADSGTFTSSSATTTTFKCTQPGPVAIKLSVSDGVCVTSLSASVYCLAMMDGGPTGGGGVGGGGGAGGSDAGMVVNTCPAEQTNGDPVMCPVCTMSQCALGTNGTDGCCALPKVADQVLCQAVVACLKAHASTCTSMGDASLCFCGTSGGACFMTPGAANGPCVAAVIAAAKTTSPPEIFQVFTSPSWPLGRAVNLLSCWGAFCTAECAVP